MSEETEVPYHEWAPTGSKCKLVGRKVAALDGDRTIEVASIEGHDGFYFRIKRATEDGRVSVLRFTLTTEAAWVLNGLLAAKLEEIKT